MARLYCTERIFHRINVNNTQAIASIFEGTGGITVEALLAPGDTAHGTVLMVSNAAVKTYGAYLCGTFG